MNEMYYVADLLDRIDYAKVEFYDSNRDDDTPVEVVNVDKCLDVDAITLRGYGGLRLDDFSVEGTTVRVYADVRRCDVCGAVMFDGYVLDGGAKYYCSDECLHTDFTDEEWEQACDENEDNYWTQWY